MLQDLMSWISEYSTGIIALVVTGLTGGGVILLRKQIVKIAKSFIGVVINVIIKLYGGTVDEDEITMTFNALPFVQDLKAQVNKMKIDDEIKLIQIKQRLLSPKLNEVEKISYGYQYTSLMKKLGDSISEDTKSIILRMEQAAQISNT